MAHYVLAGETSASSQQRKILESWTTKYGSLFSALYICPSPSYRRPDWTTNLVLFLSWPVTMQISSDRVLPPRVRKIFKRSCEALRDART